MSKLILLQPRSPVVLVGDITLTTQRNIEKALRHASNRFENPIFVHEGTDIGNVVSQWCDANRAVEMKVYRPHDMGETEIDTRLLDWLKPHIVLWFGPLSKEIPQSIRWARAAERRKIPMKAVQTRPAKDVEQ